MMSLVHLHAGTLAAVEQKDNKNLPSAPQLARDEDGLYCSREIPAFRRDD